MYRGSETEVSNALIVLISTTIEVNSKFHVAVASSAGGFCYSSMIHPAINFDYTHHYFDD